MAKENPMITHICLLLRYANQEQLELVYLFTRGLLSKTLAEPED